MCVFFFLYPNSLLIKVLTPLLDDLLLLLSSSHWLSLVGGVYELEELVEDKLLWLLWRGAGIFIIGLLKNGSDCGIANGLKVVDILFNNNNEKKSSFFDSVVPI